MNAQELKMAALNKLGIRKEIKLNGGEESFFDWKKKFIFILKV